MKKSLILYLFLPVLLYSQYHDAAKSLFNRMSVPQCLEMKTLISKTITRLDDNGMWNKFDALWVMAAHDSSTALLNWVENDHNLTVGANTVYFVVDSGFYGDGDSGYLSTNYLAADTNNLSLTSGAIGVWVWKKTARNEFEIGAYGSGNGYTSLAAKYSTGVSYGVVGGAATAANYSSAIGPAWHTASRYNAANIRLMQNTTQKADVALPRGVNVLTLELFLLARNSSTPSLFSKAGLCVAFVSSGISVAENDSMYAIFGDYLADLPYALGTGAEKTFPRFPAYRSFLPKY
jgi:hypothetical protein